MASASTATTALLVFAITAIAHVHADLYLTPGLVEAGNRKLLNPDQLEITRNENRATDTGHFVGELEILMNLLNFKVTVTVDGEKIGTERISCKQNGEVMSGDIDNPVANLIKQLLPACPELKAKTYNINPAKLKQGELGQFTSGRHTLRAEFIGTDENNETVRDYFTVEAEGREPLNM